ncbi:hypothetical protein LAHI110946_00370 [Lactococcus hircilactis]
MENKKFDKMIENVAYTFLVLGFFLLLLLVQLS